MLHGFVSVLSQGHSWLENVMCCQSCSTGGGCFSFTPTAGEPMVRHLFCIPPGGLGFERQGLFLVKLLRHRTCNNEMPYSFGNNVHPETMCSLASYRLFVICRSSMLKVIQ